MKIILLSLLLYFHLPLTFAQDIKKDLQLIEQLQSPAADTHHYSFHSLHRQKHPKSVNRFNPLNLAFSGLMYFYKNVFASQLAAGCLYEPSCAAFSVEAISQFGLIKGICLTADRLCRCTPLVAYSAGNARKTPDPASRYKLRKHE
jgi:putative component of membrane protein insertase Oxa1/YidC/SpoIIIJ protein YidD